MCAPDRVPVIAELVLSAGDVELREQVADFLAELQDAQRLADEFVATFEEDADGEETMRSELAAQRRLLVRPPEVDGAVAASAT